MPASSPPLTADQIEYLESAASILVGTCNSELAPEGPTKRGQFALEVDVTLSLAERETG